MTTEMLSILNTQQMNMHAKFLISSVILCPHWETTVNHKRLYGDRWMVFPCHSDRSTYWLGFRAGVTIFWPKSSVLILWQYCLDDYWPFIQNLKNKKTTLMTYPHITESKLYLVLYHSIIIHLPAILGLAAHVASSTSDTKPDMSVWLWHALQASTSDSDSCISVSIMGKPLSDKQNHHRGCHASWFPP